MHSSMEAVCLRVSKQTLCLHSSKKGDRWRPPPTSYVAYGQGGGVLSRKEAVRLRGGRRSVFEKGGGAPSSREAVTRLPSSKKAVRYRVRGQRSLHSSKEAVCFRVRKQTSVCIRVRRETDVVLLRHRISPAFQEGGGPMTSVP